MHSGNPSQSESTSPTMRTALKSVLFRRDDPTLIEECRRCGTTVESGRTACPCCDCDDIVEYRIE